MYVVTRPSVTTSAVVWCAPSQRRPPRPASASGSGSVGPSLPPCVSTAAAARWTTGGRRGRSGPTPPGQRAEGEAAGCHGARGAAAASGSNGKLMVNRAPLVGAAAVRHEMVPPCCSIRVPRDRQPEPRGPVPASAPTPRPGLPGTARRSSGSCSGRDGRCPSLRERRFAPGRRAAVSVTLTMAVGGRELHRRWPRRLPKQPVAGARHHPASAHRSSPLRGERESEVLRLRRGLAPRRSTPRSPHAGRSGARSMRSLPDGHGAATSRRSSESGRYLQTPRLLSMVARRAALRLSLRRGVPSGAGAPRWTTALSGRAELVREGSRGNRSLMRFASCRLAVQGARCRRRARSAAPGPPPGSDPRRHSTVRSPWWRRSSTPSVSPRASSGTIIGRAVGELGA